jgi:hypothetical protein
VPSLAKVLISLPLLSACIARRFGTVKAQEFRGASTFRIQSIISFMADISKVDAHIALESRLLDVSNALRALDQLVSKAEGLEAELAVLKAKESGILSDSSKSDDKKLPDLLNVRGSIDLKQASIDALRGVKGTNNVPAIKGQVEQAEEQVAAKATIVSQFLTAFHAAALVTLEQHIAKQTEAFVLPSHVPELMITAGKHPNVRQLQAFWAPLYLKDIVRGYDEAISQARSLPAIWKNLSDVADGIPHDLAPVSIPDPWL